MFSALLDFANGRMKSKTGVDLSINDVLGVGVNEIVIQGFRVLMVTTTDIVGEGQIQFNFEKS